MKTRVLLVEDNVDLRAVLVECLETVCQYDVTVTSSGREAIEKGRKEHYDVIISDVGLPDVDGWTVAELVRRRKPDVRIYLMTGWNLVNTEGTPARSLINGMIKKPFMFTELLQLLEEGKHR